MASWLPHNLPELIGYIGVIGGLIFNGISVRDETKARRVSNLLMMTQNHREIWSEYARNQSLWRVLDPAANIITQKITPAEETFVLTVIQQVNSVYQTMKDGLTVKPEGIRRDVRDLFMLPIFKNVWSKMRQFQNEDFVTFIESCLKSN